MCYSKSLCCFIHNYIGNMVTGLLSMDYLLRCTFPKAICCIPQNYCNILKMAFYKQLVKATK